MPLDIPTKPALWLPPKPAIIRATEAPSPRELERAKRALAAHEERKRQARIMFVRRKSKIGGNDANTLFLFHFDGSDGSTTLTDSSSYNRTATHSGNTQIDTADSKFGGASLLMDGSGDYFTLADSADFNVVNFTFDFWMKSSAAAGHIFSWDEGSGSVGYDRIGIVVGVSPWTGGTANKLRFSAGDGGALTSSTSVNTGAWIHVAIMRTGGTTYLFINGVMEASGNLTNNAWSGDNLLYFGASSSVGMGQYYNGWLDELRLSNIARWPTSGFTPPTGPYTT